MTEKQEAIDRLREIQEEIGNLVHEAKDIIKDAAPGGIRTGQAVLGCPH